MTMPANHKGGKMKKLYVIATTAAISLASGALVVSPYAIHAYLPGLH